MFAAFWLHTQSSESPYTTPSVCMVNFARRSPGRLVLAGLCSLLQRWMLCILLALYMGPYHYPQSSLSLHLGIMSMTNQKAPPHTLTRSSHQQALLLGPLLTPKERLFRL